jgi:hypothetical protein
MVECQLPKLRVAGSIAVARSKLANKLPRQRKDQRRQGD